MTENNDIDFLVSEVTLNFAREYTNSTRDKIDQLCRKQLSKPVIYIGAGTCGLAAGAGEALEAVTEYLEANQLDAEIVQVGCIGLCSSEPLMDFQMPGKARVSFQKVTPAVVPVILNECFHAQLSGYHILGQIYDESHEIWDDVPIIQELPFFKKQTRILLDNYGMIDPSSLKEYLAHDGYQSFVKTIFYYTPEDVCEMIEKSGLRGRGGGGFNTGKKWKSVRTVGSDQKYLICNADESDPGAYMDRSLIEGNPHRIVEGIAISAYAIGATKAYIYIRSEYALAVERLKLAINQAKEAGFLGENIQHSGFRLQIFLREGPGAFVCGEETALLKSLEGRRGMPRSKPPFPTEKGLFGKPTAINNVETLANIPVIMKNGPNWFASIGSKDSHGTKLFALTGDNINTGLIEVPFGITLEEIIFEIGGGLKEHKKLKAIQIGGPSGSLIPEHHIDIKIDYQSFEEQNLIMGSGGFVVMDQSACIVDIVKYFIHFLQNESCGKCIPCREGTNRMYEILKAITRRPGDTQGHQPLLRFKGVLQLENLAEVIKETSLCGLGKTASNPVLSALKWFREEFEEHIYERKCRANVCRDLRTYIISAERCTGCTICLKKCPEDAITGSVREVHTIIQSKCTSCGICYDSCRFSAIDIF
jgi:NADH:ubiquinone oxidoreductase subunit F (NADH-binding)